MTTFEVLRKFIFHPSWDNILIWYSQCRICKVSNESSRFWKFLKVLKDTENFFKKWSQIFKEKTSGCGYDAKKVFIACLTVWGPLSDPILTSPSQESESLLWTQRGLDPWLDDGSGQLLGLEPHPASFLSVFLFLFNSDLFLNYSTNRWTIFWCYHSSLQEKITFPVSASYLFITIISIVLYCTFNLVTNLS